MVSATPALDSPLRAPPATASDDRSHGAGGTTTAFTAAATAAAAASDANTAGVRCRLPLPALPAFPRGAPRPADTGEGLVPAAKAVRRFTPPGARDGDAARDGEAARPLPRLLGETAAGLAEAEPEACGLPAGEAAAVAGGPGAGAVALQRKSHAIASVALQVRGAGEKKNTHRKMHDRAENGNSCWVLSLGTKYSGRGIILGSWWGPFTGSSEECYSAIKRFCLGLGKHLPHPAAVPIEP